MHGRARTAAIGGDVRAALVVAAVLTLLALLIDNGTVGLLLGMIVFALVVYSASQVPIRYTMMTLMFFALALPNPAEGQPTEWAPPFTIVGAALLNHLNVLDHSGLLGSIPVSSMEILFFVLLLVRLHRKSSRSRIEGDVIPTPKPLIKLAYLSLLAGGFTWLHGLATGGDFGMSLWQLNAVIYLPIVFLLFQAGVRGPQDLKALGKVVLAATIYKCLLAVYVVRNISVPMDIHTGSTKPAYATAHADSMLFAAAFLIVFGLLIEPFKARTKWFAVALVPLIVAGTIANNRRLAWVQIAIVLVMSYLLSRETKLKRIIRRLVQVSVPVLLIYVAAGWNSGSSIFKPVRIMRSVVDAKSDGSSLWREIENFNIIVTFRHNPIFGSGYGHPYEEVIMLPPIPYALERYIPHNSLLSLWAYAGVIGFTGLTLLWIAGVYFAVRAYHGGRDSTERVAAMACFGAVPIYLVQSWGDLGLNTWTGIFMMGASLSVGGKLAVAQGQWRERGGPAVGKAQAARPAPRVRVEPVEPPRANTAM